MMWSTLLRRRTLVVALTIVASAAVLPFYRPAAAQAPATPAPATSLVAETADQISRLVEQRKIDDLATLTIPAADGTAKLSEWRTEYVAAMGKSETLRKQHYDEAVGKAKDYIAADKLDEAVDKAVAAYLLIRDQNAFQNLDWVKDLTEKVSKRAADYEKAGQWLESLQLYTDLNSIYEVDTRFKADMQRLARRVRLLALYTPKTLFDMRKAITAKRDHEKGDGSATNPMDEAPPAFPRWQDHVEGITQEMARQAIDEAQSKWVEGTNYDVLLRGGVEALRLFLTTPELSKEFPALADAKAKAGFAATLDSALDEIKPTNRMDAGRMHDLMAGILKSNDETVKLPEAVALMEFTDGAMEKLDPFTAVIWPHEADEFEKSTSGIFGGVGIQIMLDPAGLLKVVSPLEETPAINAGIQAGDTIVGIDGKSASGISIDQAVHRIMGPPDTKVSLTIKRDGVKDPIVYDLTRANIHVSSVKGYKRDPADPTKWLFMIDPDTHIGYIRITGFQKDTPKNLADAIESLKKQGVEGIVLDLRFNPGGLLSAAIEMSDMFLDKGTIVSTKGNRTRYWAASADGKTLVPNTLPVVVLVNQYSASASEIMSGAMKDLHRALIVGQRSFGKGSVQNVIELGSSKAAIKLTMSYYYLPNMESLHRRDRDKTWGVEPDVPVEMTPQQIGALIKSRRDADIIAKAGMTLPSSDPAPSTAPATGPAGAQPATQKAPEPLIDTQLDTALLMLRLQLLQRRV